MTTLLVSHSPAPAPASALAPSPMETETAYMTQNELLLANLLLFYRPTAQESPLDKLLKIITGDSNISLRIVDWFTTNYAKTYYTLYMLPNNDIENDNDHDNKEEGTGTGTLRRFKVYYDYRLKLKAYSKKRFDPFCRWDRISIPYKTDQFIETTIGQLNFFKWAIENKVIDYIETNYRAIEQDMVARNTSSKRKLVSTNSSGSSSSSSSSNGDKTTTRKKREELSVSATKSIKMEKVEIVIQFH